MDTPDHVYTQLRRLGLRPTSARICVVQMVQQCPEKAISADGIFRQLGEMGLSMSLGTVYRALNDLERHGVLRREWSADPAGKSRFALASAQRQPQSCAYTCPVCARSTPVMDQQFNELLRQHARAAGYDSGAPQITIPMICGDCRATGN